MHYIDDHRYAENFVDVNKKKHSRKWIELRLQQKGIKKDLSDDFFDEEYSEDAPIKKAIEKKLKGASIQTREQREKILASLYRQGFSIYNIKKVLKEYEYND